MPRLLAGTEAPRRARWRRHLPARRPLRRRPRRAHPGHQPRQGRASSPRPSTRTSRRCWASSRRATTSSSRASCWRRASCRPRTGAAGERPRRPQRGRHRARRARARHARRRGRRRFARRHLRLRRRRRGLADGLHRLQLQRRRPHPRADQPQPRGHAHRRLPDAAALERRGPAARRAACAIEEAHDALVSIDGRDEIPLAVGDRVEVRARQKPIDFIQPRGALPFWDLLRQKAALLPA